MIIGAPEIVFASVSLIISLSFAQFYRSGVGVVRRIRRQATVAAADVEAGPAELAGRLRAVEEPLTSLAGVKVVALKRSIKSSTTGVDQEGQSITTKVITTCVDVELTDATGSCILEMDQMILLGPQRTFDFTGAQCKEKAPEIWDLVTRGLTEGTVVNRVTVEETVIPEDVEGFVSGEASPSDRLAPDGGSYRGGARRLKVTGRSERPLIVAAWKEEVVLQALSGPLNRIRAVAIIGFVFALATLVIPIVMGRLAGL